MLVFWRRDLHVNLILFLHSHVSERGFQQEPVIQHAGFPSEVHRGISENPPGRPEQSGLPTPARVRSILFFVAVDLHRIIRLQSKGLISSSSLVVQLARDLQTDFYPHFPDFFLLITSLLDTKDTELLEWSFTCLSYLYKYLWRLMVKDMANIYR